MNDDLSYLENRIPKPIKQHSWLYRIVRAWSRLIVWAFLLAFCIAFWIGIYFAVWALAGGGNSASAAPVKAPHSVSSHWTRGPCLPEATACPAPNVPDWAKQ